MSYWDQDLAQEEEMERLRSDAIAAERMLGLTMLLCAAAAGALLGWILRGLMR